MMASQYLQSLAVVVILSLATSLVIPTNAQLTPNFYEKACPQALPIIRSVVQSAINRERRMGASLLRLHFHDCFVSGCDGSILLDGPNGEKTVAPNANSVRGFAVIDQIKAAVDKACKRPVVSCADILAVAARDSVSILGGPLFNYQVLLGRRDSRTGYGNAVASNLPGPNFNFSQLLSNFQSHGLTLKDLVVLSGGHTIGFARCATFRARIHNSRSIIDPKFAASLRGMCPASGGGNNLAPLDATPSRVDNAYYRALINKRGLLHSDQELFKGNGGASDGLVRLYSTSVNAFAGDFGASMVKMGNMEPLTGLRGEIRVNCRKVN